MSYKTILVHLNNDKRASGLVKTGLTLARRFEAHLIGLYVFPAYRLKPPVPVPFSAELAARIQASIQQEQERIKSIFDELTANQQVVAEWRAITTEHRDAASIVLEHGCAADLVIASQADPSWDMTDILDLPDELALGSGGPVLILPLEVSMDQLPKVITVAWNGKRESARAIHDAMPLLKAADKVDLVTVGDVEGLEGELPDTELAAALARHDIKVEVCRIPVGTASTVGETIRSHALDSTSELLVMGCYGHSRLREFAFGGVTRHILRDMSIPVMFSH